MAEDQNRTFQDKFMLRFPDGMRDRLKAEAAKNNRSMNAEIISRLEETLRIDSDAPVKSAQTGGDPTETSIDAAYRLVDELLALRSRLDALLDDPAMKGRFASGGDPNRDG